MADIKKIETAKTGRKAQVYRTTNETDITLDVNLDGTGQHSIKTGVGFFDHMLEQLSKHSLIDMSLQAKGDLHIDAHHTVEDIGWALGEALKQAVGDKIGIRRYGSFYVPMDEALSRVSLDFSGRPHLVWRVSFTQSQLGEMDTELFQEFFEALVSSSGLTLHVHNLEGTNNHHIIESVFKATAKALRTAVEIDPRASDSLASTKGAL